MAPSKDGRSKPRRYATSAVGFILLISCSDGGEPSTSRIKWRANLGAAVYYSSPAISPSGDIYVGTGIAGDNNVPGTGLYALSRSGARLWSFPTNAPVFTPAVGTDGLVYVQDATSSLYALSSTGQLRWSRMFSQSSGVGQVSPAIGADGTVYVGADGVYAFNPSGVQLWHYADAQGSFYPVRSSPAVAPDGTIVVGVNSASGAMAAAVWKLNANGTRLWTTLLQQSFTFSSPAIGSDGGIYIGSEGGDVSSLTALRADGTIRWHYDVTGGRPIRSSPSISVDGTVYVTTKATTSQPALLLAVNADGSLKWSFTITGLGAADSYCSPAIASDRTLFFGAETGLLYAVSPAGSLLWTENLKNGINWTSPAIDTDGTVYIGNNSGSLFAVRSSAGALANSSWPKFRSNNRNAGRQ